MSAPFAVRGLDHVVLRTTNPGRLERFYVDVLGCPVELRQEKFNLTQLRAGTALIDIVAVPASEPTGPARANMDHLCVRIEPFEPDRIRAHLERHGVGYGDIADRYGAEGRGPSIYIEDPDGNRVELKGPSAASG